jgi:hypothetical protein
MNTLYVIVLFVHIVGMLALFLAIGVQWIALMRLYNARVVVQVREWVNAIIVLGRIAPVASLLILAAGLYMTFAEWSIATAWIDVSLAAFVLLGVLGSAVNRRKLAAIQSAARQTSDGVVTSELKLLINDATLRTSVYTSGWLGLGIVCLMTVKPDLIGSLAVMAVSVLLGLLSARIPRRAQKATSEEHIRPKVLTETEIR